MNKLTNLSLRQQAYEKTKEMILVGEKLPGEIIDTNALAEKLAIGRTPVREALLHLECDQIVEFLPKKGARVIPLDVWEMQNLREILRLLETEIVGQATENATEEALGALRDCVGRMAKAVELQHHEDWCLANELFYRELHKLCPNSRLAKTASEHRDKFLRAHFAGLRLYAMAEKRQAVQEALDLTDYMTRNDVMASIKHFGIMATAGAERQAALLDNHGLRRV